MFTYRYYYMWSTYQIISFSYSNVFPYQNIIMWEIFTTRYKLVLS